MGATNTSKNNIHSNTGRVDYILANIYLTYIVGYLIIMVERKLGMLIDHDALIRATLCMCLSCLICILASAWHTEKKSGIFLNVIVSTEVFLLSLHMNDGKLLSILPIALLIGVTTISTICFLLFIKSDRGVRKQSAKYRCRQLFVIERFFAAALCPAILLVVGIQTVKLPDKSSELFESGYVQAEGVNVNDTAVAMSDDAVDQMNYEPHPVYDDAYMMSNNLERIKPIANAEEWDALTLEQKQDTMRAVTECELRYLGIPFPVEIQFVDLEEDKNTLAGYYTRDKHQISFNNYALKEYGNEQNLQTALHEVRHVYQGCMCDIYIRLSDEEKALDAFYGVDKWCDDFDNYKEKQKNEWSYQYMSVERDARLYAQKEADVYVSEIEKRLANQ